MPILPSGLQLALSRDAFFDHGGNWFDCPEGHFWYWAPDPDMGPPPFDPDTEILQVAQPAPVPETREEVKQYVRVLEIKDGLYGWRGEWLSYFPKYMDLAEQDLAAWEAWLNRPETETFLDDTIAKCQRLADLSQNARGYAVVEGVGEVDERGVRRGHLKVPMESSQ